MILNAGWPETESVLPADCQGKFRLSRRCGAPGLFEQTVESRERFTASTLLILTNPPLNRCGPSIWVAGRFGSGRNLNNFTFPVLDDFDYRLGVHLS
jgi:hypothetical protein